jgi:glycerol kinase
LIRTSEEVNDLAATVPDSGGVYVVPAFAGLGAPHWDAEARGLISGLTRGSTAAHLARATLESIAYQSADLIEAMQADSGQVIRELRVDGGACRSELLMQFQADLLGIPVIRYHDSESTAAGAAYLAGLGVGCWKQPQDIAAQRVIDRIFEPKISRDRANQLRAGWHSAVQRAKSVSNR